MVLVVAQKELPRRAVFVTEFVYVFVFEVYVCVAKGRVRCEAKQRVKGLWMDGGGLG